MRDMRRVEKSGEGMTGREVEKRVGGKAYSTGVRGDFAGSVWVN